MSEGVNERYVARLETLEKEVAELRRVIDGFRQIFCGGSVDVATEREMDNPQYGDPKVTIIPRDWTSGGVAKGMCFSACPPEFLDCLAEAMDYFEQKNRASGAKTSNGKLKADFDKRTARFARGWAKRIRSGWQRPEKPATPGFGSNGSGGFGSTGGRFGSTGGFGRPATTNGSSNPFARSNGFGGGFGRTTTTSTEHASETKDNVPASQPDVNEDDDGTAFPFGANLAEGAAADDDQYEEPPL